MSKALAEYRDRATSPSHLEVVLEALVEFYSSRDPDRAEVYRKELTELGSVSKP